MGKVIAWTPRQLRILRELYPDVTAETVAREIGRTATSVHQMAAKLGLRKIGADVAMAMRERTAHPAAQLQGDGQRAPLVEAPFGRRYHVAMQTQGLPPGITSVTQYRLQG